MLPVLDASFNAVPHCNLVIDRIPFNNLGAGTVATRDDLLLGHFDLRFGLDFIVNAVIRVATMPITARYIDPWTRRLLKL